MVTKIAQKSNHENYFEQATNTLFIDMDQTGTYAKVMSETGTGFYLVRIDESGDVPIATACNCPHHRYRHMYCKHMLIVDSFYQRIYNWTVSVESVMASAQVAMVQFDEDCENMYEILAPTKHLSHVDTCFYCGHLCKGDICARCAGV